MTRSTNTTIRAFDNLGLHEAITHLRDLHRDTGIIPTHAHNSVMSTVEELCRSAEALGINTLGKLCREAVAVLQHAACTDQVTGPQPTAVADRLHRYRNLALALALSCAYYLDVDAPSVIGCFPTLWARTHRPNRPHTDDEITLLRVYVIDQLRRPGKAKRAGSYAMVDAGATPVETTGITAEDFDAADEHPPTFMLIPHHTRSIADRCVELDPFAAHVLAHVLRQAKARGRDSSSPLTYDDKGGKRFSPSSSASGVLRRLHTALGLDHPDTTPASTRRWRIQITLETRGMDAATAISGQSQDDLATLIDLPAPRDANAVPDVRSFLTD
jgi:hypothetical protein